MLMQDLIAELKSLCNELANVEIGYPLGDNCVAPPGTSALRSDITALLKNGLAKQQLLEFYSKCNGISLPDVHVGYFIKSSSRLNSFDSSSEPSLLMHDQEVDILPIGSTGGGGLFVLDCSNGSVLLLPPGPMNNRIFDARNVDVKTVAENLSELIGLLISDTKAFIDGAEHTYIT